MRGAINLIKNDILTLISAQNSLIARVFLSIQKDCETLNRRQIKGVFFPFLHGFAIFL